MRTGRLATPLAALPSLANIGSRRAENAARRLHAEASGQNDDGTSTMSQSAVSLMNLEFGLGRPNSNIIVGHEGLEPSTNGLRIPTPDGAKQRDSRISAEPDARTDTRKHEGPTEQASLGHQVDAVESALADALRAATAAGQWPVVSQLAAELQARREARQAPQVVSFARARAKRNGGEQ
jgi:hypothetical protein